MVEGDKIHASEVIATVLIHKFSTYMRVHDFSYEHIMSGVLSNFQNLALKVDW